MTIGWNEELGTEGVAESQAKERGCAPCKGMI